jgi:hypothetical protein
MAIDVNWFDSRTLLSLEDRRMVERCQGRWWVLCHTRRGHVQPLSSSMAQILFVVLRNLQLIGVEVFWGSMA